MAVGHVDSGNGIRRAYSRPQTRPTLGIKATVSPRGRRPLKKRSAIIIPGELAHHGLSATKSAALAEPRDPERRLRLLERPLNSAPSPERPPEALAEAQLHGTPTVCRRATSRPETRGHSIAFYDTSAEAPKPLDPEKSAGPRPCPETATDRFENPSVPQ
jgi:hypothetical protein